MFFLSNRALEDFYDIADYTEETWGIRQRDTYLQAVDSAFRTIAMFPMIGIDADEIRKGYRKYKIGQHLIFYRISGASDVFIIRILHQSMDVDSHI